MCLITKFEYKAFLVIMCLLPLRLAAIFHGPDSTGSGRFEISIVAFSVDCGIPMVSKSTVLIARYVRLETLSLRILAKDPVSPLANTPMPPLICEINGVIKSQK